MMLKIIYRNLVHKPLNALLSLALLMLSVAIISLLMVAGSQVNEKLDNDLEGIDMVVGAKGSPLQLVLSAVYHVDAPTGNISKAEADKLSLNPFVETAIPLSYGDSYKGYRILGTTHEYIEKYDGELLAGKLNEKPMEAVLGAKVASISGLKTGDTFSSTHGEDSRGQEHGDKPFLVVGVLKPTGKVLDQLVITSLQSVWDVHGDHGHEGGEEVEVKAEVKGEVKAEGEKGNNSAGEQFNQRTIEQGNTEVKDEVKVEEEHGHEDGHEEHEHEGEEPEDASITAMLIKFRSPMGIMTLPRMINANTTMQAAVPTLEINRLMNLMGMGISTLQGIALAIMLIAGLSVFISLYNRLKERRFEHALMRSMGTGRFTIFMMLLAEGLILSISGFVAGILLCRAGIWMLNKVSDSNFHFQFAYKWVPEEGWLLAITLMIGIFAALIPAIKAFRLNIAKTLSDG